LGSSGVKRILFFMHTSSSIGGVETWLDRAHAHLSLHGFDPTVGLVRGLRYNDPTRYKAHHREIHTVEVDGRGLNREGRVRALVRCIRRVRPDIVVPLGIVDANEAVIRCKQHGDQVRLLAHAQGNLAPMLADLANYRDWIDRVVCPGRLTREVLVRWAGFAGDRVINISNGAGPATVARVPREAGAPLRVGYVGRLSRLDKRALDLIGLHSELERLGVNYRLDVVGNGPCLDELMSALSAFSPKVRMHGAVPHEELYERIFPNLDVLILTSSSEAFGIVLVEAMMYGVVPVSSRYDGFYAERLVEDGHNGLSFEVGDMAGAAAAIARLADDDALRERLSQQSLMKAADYTWARSLKRWQNALDELLKQTPVQGASIPALPSPPASGLLDRIGLPDAMSDLLRRARRRAIGPAVAPGGEEWPLFYRHHSDSTLAEVAAQIRKLDVPPQGESFAGDLQSEFAGSGASTSR